jgi:hypothetical protein
MTCPRCDHLATEVMRLREDRNAWRAMYIELIALLYALGLRRPQKCPACLSNDTSKTD